MHHRGIIGEHTAHVSSGLLNNPHESQTTVSTRSSLTSRKASATEILAAVGNRMDPLPQQSSSSGEGITRRRTISNISKIFASQRGSAGRLARQTRPPSEDGLGSSASSGCYLLPQEPRRKVHSEPGPVHLPPPTQHDARFSASNIIRIYALPEVGKRCAFGNYPLAEGTKRAWRRGRRLPKFRGQSGDRPDSSVSTLSGQTTYSTSSVESWPTLSGGTGIGEVESDYEPHDRDGHISDIQQSNYLMPEEQHNESSMSQEVDQSTSFSDSYDAESRDSESQGPSAEMLALRYELAAQVREMRELQEKYYMSLNASLQENFHATGALENRLDALASSSRNAMTSPRGNSTSPSTELMWTVVDGVSMLVLWLISVFVARPYQLLKRVFRTRDESRMFDRVASRKSWRLSASKEICFDDDRLFFSTPRRVSLREE